MGKKCSSVTDKQAEDIRKRIARKLKMLHIGVGDLSNIEIEAAMTRLATEKNLTDEVLYSPAHKQDIIDAIAAARRQKAKETKALNNTKIGKAEVHVGEKISKSAPKDNPNTVYIFTDNLQAHNALSEEKVTVPGIIVPTDGVKVNVSSTSAALRTNTNGDKNSNTFGLVVKKNAQGKDGAFLHNGEGVFEDTDEEFQAFVALNDKIITQIKEMLEAKDSPITDLHIVGKVALDNAGLPKRFAEALRNLLYNKLGISAMVLDSSFGDNLYGLEIQPFGKQTTEKKESAKEKTQKKDAEEAAKSLEASRPALASDELNLDANDVNILARVFPNIEERIARVSFISTVFTQQITHLLDYTKKYYESRLQDNPTEEEQEIYTALHRGTEAEQRKALLELVPMTEENISVADYIINNIKQFMSDVISVVDAIDAGTMTESEGADMLFSNSNYVADEFALEADDKGWRGAVVEKMKIRRLRYLAEQFKLMSNPRVFNALLKDAALEIEFNENIRIVMGENGETIVSSTSEDMQEDEGENEGRADNRSGLNIIKYKLLNPARTLSTRMKSMLSHLYRMKNGSYVYNDLGQRVLLNSSVAYYILLHHFSAMNRAEDFEEALDEAVEKYPWMAALADKLDANEDLRNEFYTAFRKIFVPYTLIGTNGKIVNLNQTANRESFMQEMTRLYEGHSPLSANSIYDIEGQCNVTNVARVHSWVVASKNTKAEDKMKRHPLAWVKQVLDRPNSKDFNTKNLIQAAKILRGEVNGLVGIEELLHALGVPTDTLDLDTLVPYIPEELENNPDGREAFEEITALFNPDVIRNISKIIQSAINITAAREGGARGFTPGDHLLDKFRSAYNNIADALSISSEALSQASFSGMDNAQMFSYTAPDKISILTGIISKAKTYEEAMQYIEEEYGDYDFFRDPVTGKWMNTWVKDLYESPALREAFTYINILGFNNRNKQNSIQNVDDATFLDGIVTAFFAANDASDGTKLGWYRNPLFSDADALVMIKQKRYTGPEYKKEILKGLAKVLRQEIDRIVTVLNQEEGTPIIEFFNDERGNGRKFNFFPSLNPRLREILDTIININENYESATEIQEHQEEYLESLILDVIEGQIQPDGARKGGELDTFLAKFDEARGSKILASIASLEAEGNEISADIFEDQEANAEDLTPEDLEEKKATISEQKKAEIKEKLTEFFWNDFFGHTQFVQMIGGDLAYYKNWDDFVKRNKENYAAGERMYSIITGPQGETVQLMEDAIYLEDLNMVSNTWTSIRDLLDAENPNLSEWEKGIYRAAVKAFTDICSTDGQSLRSLDSYKKLFKAFGGKWTDNMDTAYENIKSSKFTAADFLALWNPIKPFMVSSEAVEIVDKDGNIRNEKVGVQHKNSEYLISALFSVLNTALNDSPQLRGLQRFMEDNNIDVAHFHSVVKHGYHDAFDINYDYAEFNDAVIANAGKFGIGDEQIDLGYDASFDDYLNAANKLLTSGRISQEQYNEALQRFQFKSEDDVVRALNSQMLETVQDEDGEFISQTNSRMIKHFPLKDYMVVQPTDDHLIDHEALFGSQLRNIVPADLPDGFVTTVNINGKEVTLNKDDVIQYYNTLIVDQLLDSFDTIEGRFTDDATLAEYLQEMMRGNPKYGEDVREALSIDPKTGTFKMPFNSPNLRNKVEELLLSTFKNNIQRQKINGGNVVLVSNFGLSDKLQVKYKNDNPKEGIEYIPAYMPAYMRDMYQDYLIEKVDKDGSSYWTLDFDALKRDNNEDILKIIGYRIPTEDKYSIMPIKIVGFMPVVAGTTIMLPSDIITMSGTDFDIDKLFLMIRSVNRETYGNELTQKFREWLSPQLRKSLRETDPKQSEVVESIIHRRRGYTDDNIEALRDRSELFDMFMDSEGYSYKLQHPTYRIKRGKTVTNEDGSINLSETSKMSDDYSKRERHDIRNNMLIDTIWSILTSPEGSRLSMLPGSYPGVKHGSRQQWILQDPSALAEFIKYAGGADKVYDAIQKMSAKELEAFYEKYATPANPLTITAYVKKHRNLMDGNALIGMFAVNSSNHYKLQFLSSGRKDSDGRYIASENILLNDVNKFFFTMPGGKTMTIEVVSPQKSPITGVAIGRICAEFQAASPDNGKDPCLGDLGASINTAYRINFLANMGFTPEIIGMLNTIDDFIDYGSEQETTNKAPFDGNIARVIELVAKYRSSNGVLTDPLDIEDSKRIADWMNNIFQCASTFKMVSTVSRVDSPNGALPVSAAEAVQQMLRIEDFFRYVSSKECEIIGLDRIVDPTISIDNYENIDDFRDAILAAPIPRLQAAYTLGIRDARNLAGNKLIQLREPVLAAVRMFRNQAKKSLVYGGDIAILQKFFSEMGMFLLSSGGSLFASDADGSSIMEKRNYYIHDFPMKFKAFLDEKDSNGSYKHAAIRNLDLIRRITNGNRAGIKFQNLGKVSPQSRKHYTEAMDSLLYNPDPEVQKLAIDLMMYAYYDNGLNFGPSNYGIFFTTYFLENVPKVIDVLVQQNGAAESDPTLLTNFVNQFMLNHRDVVFSPRRRDYKFIKKTDKETLTIAAKDATFLRSGIDSTGQYITYLLYRDDVYKRVIGESSATTSAVTYKKIDSNKTDKKGNQKSAKNFTPFYDASKQAEEIEWNKLADRGAVSGKNDKGKSKKETKDMKVPEEGGVEGKFVPQEGEKEIDGGIADALTKLDGEEGPEISSVPNEEAYAEKMKRIADSLRDEEPALKAPEEPTEPDLKTFKDTDDPNNRMCIPNE